MDTLAALLHGPLGSALERDVLPAWLPERRWFRAKARPVAAVALDDVIPLGSGGRGRDGAAVFAVLRVAFADGASERYALPLALAPEDASGLPAAAVVCPVRTPDGARTLIDGCWDAGFRTALFDVLFDTSSRWMEEGKGGALRGHPASSPGPHAEHRDASGVLSAEQSNTSLVYGTGAGAVFVKLYRRLEESVHPEPEMLRFLRERTGYRGVPAFLSRLEWTRPDGTPITAALAQEFFPGGENAWDHALGALRRVFADPNAATSPHTPAIPEDFAAWVARLGAHVGALHAALASRADVPEFAPEALTADDEEALRVRARALLDAGLAALEAGMRGLTPEAQALARALRAGRSRLEARLEGPPKGPPPASLSGGRAESGGARKIRTHGDLHLGQILTAGTDVRLLDFEGEPGRPLADARAKQSPWRDVAGMLRSFHYAAHHAAQTAAQTAPRNAGASADAAARLAEDLGAVFLAGYAGAPGADAARPAAAADRTGLLDLFMLEKAVYELHYECNNRPDWVPIPLRALVTFCNEPAPTALKGAGAAP